MAFGLFTDFQQSRDEVCGGVEAGAELGEAFRWNGDVVFQRVAEVVEAAA